MVKRLLLVLLVVVAIVPRAGAQALSYKDALTLANDPTFQTRVQIALTQAAIAIGSEGPGNASTTSITANTLTNPTVVTTSALHGLSTGNQVAISGSNSTPKIDGIWVVTVITSTTFSIPVNVTLAGTAGSVIALSFHASRLAYAVRVLADPIGFAKQMAVGIVSDGVNYGSGTDATLQNRVNAVWNAYAGAVP